MRFLATILTIDDENRRQKSSTNEEGLDFASTYTYLLGRFSKVAAIYHKNLCNYLEFVKCQTVPNGFVLVTENYSQNYINHDSFLNNKIGQTDQITLFSIAIQVASAIEFCHEKNITICSLDLSNLLIDATTNGINSIHVKLSNFGMCYILGEYYFGPHNSSPYQPPECLLNVLPRGDHSSYFWIDIWSFGVMLIELFTGWRLAEIVNRKQYLSILTSILCKKQTGSICTDLLEAIARNCPAFSKKRPALEPIYLLVEKCLNIIPEERPSASELMGLLESISCNIGFEECVDGTNVDLSEDIGKMEVRIKNESALERFGFNGKTVREMFYLWKLCGSTVENILARKGVIKTRPPLTTLPSLLVDNSQIYGEEEAQNVHPPVRTFALPMDNFMERIQAIPFEKLFLSFEFKTLLKTNQMNGTVGEEHSTSTSTPSQSLVVKERDIDYQFKRMHLFRRLLSAWPNKAELLREESRVDIPPVYRGPIWAALLGVLPFEADDREQTFYGLDTLAEHVSDRQLQVDIPRCHQYDELMSSPMAHYQLRVLLKAVLVSRKEEFVYWQGLDSLTAPFLILHFNDLPTAFRCLNNFIDRYLHGFFHKDNTTVIRNYLAEFMRCIEFADAELFTHLISLDFHPELFAIPWFLTCFAHVLPLHKLFHLWDALLLADAEFPLFIGVAILLQLRPKLIAASFNEAILLFSDLPDLPIDNVVNKAKHFYNKWRNLNNAATEAVEL